MSEVVYLDQVRARLLHTPLVRPQDILPQPSLAAAQDLSRLDFIRSAVEFAMRKIEVTQEPMHPNDREISMKIVALIFGPSATP